MNEPNGISTFEYDLNGNLTEISKNSAIISKYEYDIRNQLTKAKDGLDNELARFDYNFERKRVSKTNSLGTTNYVYAGNQVVSEFANNVNSASYAIGAGEIVKSEFASGENNYHFTDALGSVTSLTDTNGSLTSRNEYNAFGEISTNGVSSNSIGYTGQRLDYETGLMALGNGERYYSPNYTRFIQQDSFAGVSSMPQSLNRFAYGLNNPNKYTDPSGNEPVTLVLIGLALIGMTLLAANTNTQHAANNLEADEKGWAQDDSRRSWGTAFSQSNGMGKIMNAVAGSDFYDGRQLSTGERVWQGVTGTIEVIGNALLIGGAVFKAGGLIVNTARGGAELVGITRGAWASVKNYTPFIEDAAGVLKAVKNPFQTIKSGWNATTETAKAGWKATTEFFKNGAGEATKQTASRVWEFTKQRLNPFNYKRDGVNINFRGGNSYQSSLAYSSGEMHGADEIMTAFRNSKHTESSQKILDAIDNGSVNVSFTDEIMNGGTSSGGLMKVNKTMNMDDILTTIVHEGQHELDIAAGIIPKPSVNVTQYQRAFAEIRSHRRASEFAVLNNLTKAEAFRHANLEPIELAISIANGYKPLHSMSDADLFRAMEDAAK